MDERILTPDSPLPPKDSDSRLKGYSGQVTHPQCRAQQLYCFLCGAKAGFQSQDSSQFLSPVHVSIVCDNCEFALIATYGNVPPNAVPSWLYDAYGYTPEKPSC
jgi:hypothetical protein